MVSTKLFELARVSDCSENPLWQYCIHCSNDIKIETESTAAGNALRNMLVKM